jgi:hypothetical protein
MCKDKLAPEKCTQSRVVLTRRHNMPIGEDQAACSINNETCGVGAARGFRVKAPGLRVGSGRVRLTQEAAAGREGDTEAAGCSPHVPAEGVFWDPK